jgi:xanthine phosphoribosyltransferase
MHSNNAFQSLDTFCRFLYNNFIILSWGLPLEQLEQKIRAYGRVYPGNILKVDSFLNHQVDMELVEAIGAEFARRFAGCGCTKVLTVEASGIIVAGAAASKLHIPLLFAKKSPTKNISKDVFTTQVMSYTHGRVYDIFVSREFLGGDDRVLIIDDFMANGVAVDGLLEVCRLAGAKVEGCGVVIEKGFQSGGKRLRAQGLNVQSLVIIDSMTNTGLTFRKQ